MGWQLWVYFWAKKLDKLCVFPEVCNADTVDKTYGRINGGHIRDFAQYCKFIQPSYMPVFCVISNTLIARYVYTRDPHSLFIAPADGLALSGTRPSACALASTVTHVCLRCCYRRIRNCFELRWRHLCWLVRCEGISRHFEYKLEMVHGVVDECVFYDSLILNYHEADISCFNDGLLSSWPQLRSWHCVYMLLANNFLLNGYLWIPNH